MSKIIKRNFLAFFLVFSLVLLCSPFLVVAQNTGSGDLLGFIYTPDGTTPVKGAVLSLRNVSSGDIYQSGISDDFGVVKLNNVQEGLYIVGITTEDGDFNVENLVGIRTNSTAKVSFSLNPGMQEQALQGGEKSSECPRGEWYAPEIEGVCDDGYTWNADKNRCECEKKNGAFFAFFATPVGLAVVSAFTVGAAVGAVQLSEATNSASPHK